MQTTTTEALRVLDRITAPHAGPHTCTDGTWYNPRAGARTNCDTVGDLIDLRAAIMRLDGGVLSAADNAAAVDAVVVALVSTPLDELGEEDREGWRYMAREGITALSGWLDGQEAPRE